MTRYEKLMAAARGFYEQVDPYELMDEGMDEDEFMAVTMGLLETEPYTVLVYVGGMED